MKLLTNCELKFLVAFIFFLGYTSALECYNSVKSKCGTDNGADLTQCHAIYSGIHHVHNDINKLIHHNIQRSLEYLLMSVHFSTYKRNREGFAKLFRKLSDETWEDAFDLTKHLSKRGYKATFTLTDSNFDKLGGGLDMDELNSLSYALDIHKQLASATHKVHGEVSKATETKHDPEVTSYLEKEFIHKHAETIRDLAGHINDLKSIISEKNPEVGSFIFDEYLQKIV